MTWTPARIEYAISHYKAGESAGTIAGALGITRASVCGVLRRAGISRPPGERASLPSIWSAAEDEILRAHYGKLSPDKIAEMIGHGVTRAAVIGRAGRIGIAKKRAPRVRNLEEDRARSRRYYREVTRPKLAKLRDHKKGGFYRRAGPPKPAHMPAEPLPSPDMRMVSLIDLTPFVCHFPVGDPKQPGFGFCGAPKDSTGPYCRHHHGIAYHAISERRESLEGLARVAA